MGQQIIQVADDFWNIRGSFKVGGFVEIGTQASVVRRHNGRFVLLDACALTEATAKEVSKLTNDGEDLEAVLHLHPFHTVYVKKMHERFPNAKLYGTARHIAKYPKLPWQGMRTEDPELHAAFVDDFEFSVPRGVDFISANENVHFSSVLAYHRASKTIHVDDTLMYIRLPKVARLLGKTDSLSFHLTLANALQKRPGATQEFVAWAKECIDRWKDAENLCAAHTSALVAKRNQGPSIHARMLEALNKVEGKLRAHEKKHG